jgi:hypothetical protein
VTDKSVAGQREKQRKVMKDAICHAYGVIYAMRKEGGFLLPEFARVCGKVESELINAFPFVKKAAERQAKGEQR